MLQHGDIGMFKTKAEMKAYLQELAHQKTIEQNEKLFSLISDIQRRLQDCIDDERYHYVTVKTKKRIFFFITTEEEEPMVQIVINVMNDGVREVLSREFRSVIIKELNKLFTDHHIVDFTFSKQNNSVQYVFNLGANK